MSSSRVSTAARASATPSLDGSWLSRPSGGECGSPSTVAFRLSRTSHIRPRATLTVDAALDRILARITPLEATEVALQAALGAVLAEDAIADRAAPPFH